MINFHLSAELPDGDENREKRVEIMAKGFKTALTHAAIDPEIRLRMLMGDAYSRWNQFLAWFRGELSRESPEVQEMAEKFRSNPDLFLGGKDDKYLRAQLRLLERVKQLDESLTELAPFQKPDADRDS